MKIKLFFFRLLVATTICSPVDLTAQRSSIDSLNTLLKASTARPGYEQDSNYLNLLIEIAYNYAYQNPDTTIALSEQALPLCEKINYTTGKAEALKNIGLAYYIKSDYNKSLSVFAQALEVALDHNYISGEGKIYHNMAIVYTNLGKYPEALENYFKALEVREKLGEKYGIASSTSGIGIIYFLQGKYHDARIYYEKALKIAEEINAYSLIQSSYANIGEIYYRDSNYVLAKENLLKALRYSKQVHNNETIAFITNLLGSIYTKEHKYSDALESFHKTRELAAQIGNREFLSRSRLGIAEVYLAQHNTDSALYYAQEGTRTAAEIQYNELLRDGNEILSKIYETKGMSPQALKHFKLFKLYADSINNQQTEKAASNLAAEYEYSKKEILLKAEQAKKQVEFQKQTNQQRWIIFSAFAALFSSLVVAWLIYRSRQKEKHSNLLLHRQNEEIEKQKNTLETTLKDLKNTQAQLIQSEKMASLGELTAGIAHEIQNPLNFVNNFSEVSKELLDEMKTELDSGNTEDAKAIADDVIQNLEKINHHGKRADGIVKGMLQHSRTGTSLKEPVDLNTLCDEYVRLSYQGFKAKDKSFNTIINTEFDNSLGNINVVPQEIGRVILNLLTNAFYVVNEKKQMNIPGYEPTVSISTKKINNKAEIKVTDNGNGIPKNVLDKIFQPFFTTKPTGQGTGLGLSMSYDIVTKGHGGELKANTQEGKGTEFIIILPA